MQRAVHEHSPDCPDSDCFTCRLIAEGLDEERSMRLTVSYNKSAETCRSRLRELNGALREVVSGADMQDGLIDYSHQLWSTVRSLGLLGEVIEQVIGEIQETQALVRSRAH